MSQSLEQFVEMCDLLNEISANYPPANGAIAATNDPARKDFGPIGGNGYPPSMKRGGMLDPYQSHPDTQMPDPERPPHLPFPLETVNDFLSNSYIYLNTALQQMKSVCDNNPSIDPVFSAKVKSLHGHGRKALKAILKIGKELSVPTNLNY